MPRQKRIDAPGAVHHIIARGIERGSIFRDNQDRENFIERFGKLVQETRTQCFAWALIPNHFHLLLKTGDAPISTIMSRLLTGYAISYNRRYHRSGHLFQNRYKSIICQQDLYFKELIRYIHLNPLRAGLVQNMAELDRYRFAGHSYVLGKRKIPWQSIKGVLTVFDDTEASARILYRQYVSKGIELGKQEVLVGGGLVRSAGGWEAVNSLRKKGIFQKSDERILGDSNFVNSVLSSAQDAMDNRYKMAAAGIDLDDIIAAVSELLLIPSHSLMGPSKEKIVVKGRALVCYWGVRELGMSMTEVAGRLKISVPTVSMAARKGALIVGQENLVLSDILNIKL